MRSGYVQQLDNGNWEVVERVGKKLKVLSGPDGFLSSAPEAALKSVGLEASKATKKVAEKHPGRERWEWESDG